MKFKLVKEEAGQKVARQQQRSFNTGTILDASVGTLSDGDNSYTRITFESHGDQEARVRVDESSGKLEIFIDGEWEAMATAQAMEWAAHFILRPKMKLSHEQARAFLDALCGREPLEGGEHRPKSRAAHDHLAAVLGLGQVPTDANLAAPAPTDWRVDPGDRVRGVAEYLIAAGHALLGALEQEQEKLLRD